MQFNCLELTNKNILLISPEPWNHIFVSKHHYAINLGKRGNKVYFLNPPTIDQKIVKTGHENVWVLKYKGFVGGLRFYPNFVQKYFFKRRFEQLQNLCGSKFDIIWSFDNSVFYDFSALPDRLIKISHIVDLNQDFQLKKAVKTAQFCFGTSTAIINKIGVYNADSYIINHGCSTLTISKKFSLPGVNKLKALYSGNLDIPYVDWNLFKEIVSSNPEIDFIVAGSWSDIGKQTEMKYFSNFFNIGKLSSEELNEFYASGDILLMLYKADHFSEQVSNPHKMMGYLASGKMIVTTHTQEYLSLAERGLFLMSEENKKFPELFRAAVVDIKFWNSEERQLRRKAFAMDNTYEKQLDRIENIIYRVKKS